MPERPDRTISGTHWEDIKDRMRRHWEGLTHEQRVALYFELTRLMLDGCRADPAADPRWIDAAEREHAQVGTLLLRAKGYTTEAMALDAALARAGGNGDGTGRLN